jgi:hypothetical protein
MSFCHVIKPNELPALNFLPGSHPKPIGAQWINRGTDRPLRRQSIDLLLRTLYTDVLSESVLKLHQSSGLRVEFRSEAERYRFAQEFAAAKALEEQGYSNRISMMFGEKAAASAAADELIRNGVPKRAVSILWRAGRFMDADVQWIEGHSLLSVAGATAGGSFAGLALGVALIAVPGIGQIAAVGGLAASAASSAPALAGIFGATTGALIKMLSDPDVEDVEERQYIARRKASPVFVSVELTEDTGVSDLVRTLIRRHGGRLVTRGEK